MTAPSLVEYVLTKAPINGDCCGCAHDLLELRESDVCGAAGVCPCTGYQIVAVVPAGFSDTDIAPTFAETEGGSCD